MIIGKPTHWWHINASPKTPPPPGGPQKGFINRKLFTVSISGSEKVLWHHLIPKSYTSQN